MKYFPRQQTQKVASYFIDAYKPRVHQPLPDIRCELGEMKLKLWAE